MSDYDAHDGFSAAMIVVCTLGAIFCCFGMYKSIEQAGIRADRCTEIQGQRVPGKYNGALCLIEGRVVDVDRWDYRERAALIREDDDD